MNEQVNITIMIFFTIALFILLSGFIVAFIFRYKQRQTEHEKEKQQLIMQQENEVVKAQLEISEELMKNISTEIHDNIGQSLSLAKLTLHHVDNENYTVQTQQTTEILTRAIADLRNLSKSLNGNFLLEIGLKDAIEREITLLNNAGKIQCMYSHAGEDYHLNDNQEVILFRCVQEAMNNCIKHAEASEIRITTEVRNGLFTLCVKDNGKGFDTAESKINGIGMSSMRERARLMGGALNIKSKQGDGTTLCIEIPLVQNNKINTQK